ncbi:conserved hypothetical protein [Vibrio phage 236O40-1]|nr:conserved hypothetical protein [Vibrio phage 236O40-1]
MLISPDVEDILDAISIINGGNSIIPEDLGSAVSHTISRIGPSAIRECANKTEKEKRKYLIEYARSIRA